MPDGFFCDHQVVSFRADNPLSGHHQFSEERIQTKQLNHFSRVTQLVKGRVESEPNSSGFHVYVLITNQYSFSVEYSGGA